MTVGTTAFQNFEGGHVFSRKCGGAIEANRAVKLDTTEGQVIACTAITDVAIGVSLGKYASGDIGQFQSGGVAKLTISAAVALGAQVMPTSSGAGKVSTSSGATANSIGISESEGDADGQIIKVRLAMPNLKGPANS